MSLRSICNEVLLQSGFPGLNTVMPSNDPQAMQMFSLANAELVFLSQQHKWPHLEREHTFTTAPGVSEYPLPADFRVLQSDTMFDAGQYYSVRGSVPDNIFMAMKYGNYGDLARSRFRVRYDPRSGTDVIALLGTPSNARNLVCLYQTNIYAKSASGSTQSKYERDDDVSLIPEELVKLGLAYRFRRAKGLDYSVELVEYNTAVGTQLSKFSGAGSIPVGHYRVYDDLPEPNIPENGFGQ